MQRLRENARKLKLWNTSHSTERNLHLLRIRRRDKNKKSPRVIPEIQNLERGISTAAKENTTLQTARTDSGLTFDLNEITAGVNGDKVTNTRRSWRVSVRILGARDLKSPKTGFSTKDPLFKVRVHQSSEVSNEIEKYGGNKHGAKGGNHTFNFEVQDIETATLSVDVYSTAIWGMKELLGSCAGVNIANFVKENEARKEDATGWCDLFSEDGDLLPGKVLLHIEGVMAEPERKVGVFVGTWNVGNARPVPSELCTWLPSDKKYHVVAIGTQECEYQSQKTFADCGKEWLQMLQSSLGAWYKLIQTISKGQMRLAIFVQDDLVRATSEIDSGSVATGVGSVIANKGGVAISFKLWDTSLCFINCHFAAHEGFGRCVTRNSNYRDIAGQLRIGCHRMDILNQFDSVFWFGDLNYRLDLGENGERKKSWGRVIKAVESGCYKDLLQFDELRREKEASRVLYGFKEGEIEFPPTFKVKKGSLSSYNKKRMPAWCDRILWRTLPGNSTKLMSYLSIPTVLTSDHKPVVATFMLSIHALPRCYIPSIEEDDRRWHIRFTSLRARNLRASDINGFSDPYICFEDTNILRATHSTVKARTVNPTWNPKELRPLVLKAFPLQRLEKEYLLVRVLDYNYASDDDTLGYTAIPLAQAVHAFKKGSNGFVHFKVGLSQQGLPAGTLEGGMQLTWEKNILKRKAFAKESMTKQQKFQGIRRIMTKKNLLRRA